MLTKDGLTIYDLDPNASELWAVAGPEGYDVKAIDPDNLPPGFSLPGRNPPTSGRDPFAVERRRACEAWHAFRHHKPHGGSDQDAG